VGASRGRTQHVGVGGASTGTDEFCPPLYLLCIAVVYLWVKEKALGAGHYEFSPDEYRWNDWRKIQSCEVE